MIDPMKLMINHNYTMFENVQMKIELLVHTTKSILVLVLFLSL